MTDLERTYPLLLKQLSELMLSRRMGYVVTLLCTHSHILGNNSLQQYAPRTCHVFLSAQSYSNRFEEFLG